VAFVPVSYDNMAHRRRQIGSACATRRVMAPFQPRNVNQRPPAQKVDLMKTVYPEEDYCRKSLTLSIVPEVDEEEEQTVNTLSVAFSHTEESPKNLKRKSSLVELVLDVALLIRLKVKGKE